MEVTGSFCGSKVDILVSIVRHALQDLMSGSFMRHFQTIFAYLSEKQGMGLGEKPNVCGVCFHIRVTAGSSVVCKPKGKEDSKHLPTFL